MTEFELRSLSRPLDFSFVQSSLGAFADISRTSGDCRLQPFLNNSPILGWRILSLTKARLTSNARPICFFVQFISVDKRKEVSGTSKELANLQACHSGSSKGFISDRPHLTPIH